MQRKMFTIGFAALLLAMLASCATTKGMTMSKVKKTLKKGEWASPENSTLFFTSNTEYNDFLQQNPDIGYNFYTLIGREEYVYVLFNIPTGSVGFIEPLPVGSELKLFSETKYYGRDSTTNYYGIAGVDVVLTEPGLYYYGKDNEKHSKELSCLKILAKYFKGSEWEKVISDRIEEIKNAKKK